MTSDGTVIATIAAAGVRAPTRPATPTRASTSTDNTVTYDTTGPVTSSTAVAPTPTNSAPTVTAR